MKNLKTGRTKRFFGTLVLAACVMAIGATSAFATPPTITIGSPANGSTQPSLYPVLLYTATSGSTITCTMNGVSTGCSNFSTLGGTVVGQNTLSVTATLSGETATAVSVFTTDPPVVTITSPTANSYTGGLVTLNFSAAESTTSSAHDGDGEFSYYCSLDSGTNTACSSGVQYDLSVGSHTLRVRAIDGQGFQGVSTVTVTRALKLDSPLNGSVQPTMYPILLRTALAGWTVTCTLNGVSVGCSNMSTLGGTMVGQNTLVLTATSGANSATDTSTFTIDPPVVSLSVSTSGNTATATFSAVESATSGNAQNGGDGEFSYVCKLDTGSYASCTSPKVYNGLSSGSHTLSVKGYDTQGYTGIKTVTFTI